MLLAGCAKEQPIPTVDFDQLEERDGIAYEPNEEKPYTGDAVRKYPNGQTKEEVTYKDGIKDGLRTAWYENGRMKEETTYKDGKQHGPFTSWHNSPNKTNDPSVKSRSSSKISSGVLIGQKKFEATYKNGRLHGLTTTWYKNGHKKKELTLKEGEMISAKYWDEDGNPK